MARSGRSTPSARAAKEIVQKISNDLMRKVASVRALWLAVQNEPNKSYQDMERDGTFREFYGAVGELLEGKTLEEIELHKIDPKRVYPHIKEG